MNKTGLAKPVLTGLQGTRQWLEKDGPYCSLSLPAATAAGLTALTYSGIYG